MKKRLLLLISSLILSVSVFSQQDTTFHRTIINIGYSYSNDLSVMVGGYFTEDGCFGSIDYSRNLKIDLQTIHIGIGFGHKDKMVFLKPGICIIDNQKKKFDIGIEYLWLLNSDDKVTLNYGIGYTKWTGLQAKLGVSF